MKIGVIGTGYVGLIVGACFSDLGNDVVCMDIDSERINNLNQGKIPIYEEGLPNIVQRNISQGRLSFTTDIKKAILDVVFICVGTPQQHDGQADISSVLKVAENIALNIENYSVIVVKSTVPIGTCEKVKRTISEKTKVDFSLVSNPEFLREGAAVKDFRNPDRTVIGVEDERSEEVMKKLYSPLARTDRPLIFTKIASSEMIKYASNAMLATRISFMNELSSLCEVVGADIKEVSYGMGFDRRIGPRFLQAGAGYGGSCFPKDVRALAQVFENNNLSANIMRAVDYANERQKKSIFPKLMKTLNNIEGKTIAIWGLAFKPRTDDIREAPALTLIEQLQNSYAKVKVYDPVAMDNARKILKNVEYAENPYDAAVNSDSLIVITEWDEFREIDLAKVKNSMNQPVLIDARNIYDLDEIKKLGFTYIGVGRK
jgi:UDPglucose 6-dehydrogenase